MAYMCLSCTHLSICLSIYPSIYTWLCTAAAFSSFTASLISHKVSFRSPYLVYGIAVKGIRPRLCGAG